MVDEIIRDGEMVYEALYSRILVPQKLVGCIIDIDDGSAGDWTILSINDTNNTFVVHQESLKKELAFIMLSRGNLVIPTVQVELIAFLDKIEQEQAKIGIGAVAKRKNYSDKQALYDEFGISAGDEILKLFEINKDRAHHLKALLSEFKKNSILIPKLELDWLSENGANKIVKSYENKKLFNTILNVDFSLPKDSRSHCPRPFEIASIHKYFPKKDFRSDLDTHSAGILEFKNGNQEWVERYTAELDAIIAANTVICCAPSHDRGRWGPSLVRAIEILGSTQGRQAMPELLFRNKFTRRRSEPNSDRSKDLNRETIEVRQAASIKNKPVIVIDDVTTTGSTLAVCAEKIWYAGCNCVGAIAIARTVSSWGA